MTAPDRDALVDELADAPRRIALAARTADRSSAPVPAGEWTAAEVVRHLISVERVVWQPRIDRMLAEDEPAWAWTEPGPDEATAGLPLEDVLGAFATAREATLARVRGLDDAGWARVGVHATYGRLAVADLLTVARDHDEEHLEGLAERG